LSERQQYLAARSLTSCAYRTRDYPTALQMSRIATRGPIADKTDWYYRTLVAFVSREQEDASASLERLVAWPEMVENFRLQTIFAILSDVDGTPEGDARNARIVKALYDAKWRPEGVTPDKLDPLWQRHVRYLLKAGNVAEARKVAADIVSPDFAVTVHAEKRYAPLLEADPGRYDILKAYKGAAVRLKKAVAAAPDKLEPVVSLTYVLYQLDRPEEGLAFIDAKLVEIKAGKKFADQDEQRNWLHDRRANLLLALGRTDEALAAYQTAASLNESGNPNVSQAINFADTLYGLGRPAEAVAMLAGFDPKNASPYGVMAAEHARACAYVQLGDQAALAKSLAYVRAHAKDAPAVAVSALLCAGEENEAAALAIRFLGDETTRDDLLARLHRHQNPAKQAEMPFESRVFDRWRRLAMRPDVAAAVEPFGHILELPVGGF
jgi:tetratricopeptide (TPR) repeat protein